MSDLSGPDDPAPQKKHRILRETWRQEKVVVWVRGAVIERHLFLAYDRAAPRGDKSHLFQWKRGVRADTLDTELIVFGRSLRFELKAPGEKVDDGDGQWEMIQALRRLDVRADWGITIMDLFRFYREAGVKLAANAEYQATVYDGMVDSRIAKEEGKMPVPVKKKSRPSKAARRFAASKGFARRAAGKGILI